MQNSTFDLVLAQQVSLQNSADIIYPMAIFITNTIDTSTSSLSSPTASSSLTSAANSTATPSGNHKRSSGGMITGAALGGFAVVACLSLAVYFYVRYRRRRTPHGYYEGYNASLLSMDGPSVPSIAPYPLMKSYVRTVKPCWLCIQDD